MESLAQELEEVEVDLLAVEEELQELLAKQSSLLDRRKELQALISERNNSIKQKKAHQWEGTNFKWTKDLDENLKNVFQIRSLRPMQRQTMNATLAKEDTLLIMPTGGGKSLCFQLPAVIDKGITLVVSPLVSLMEDQLMALQQLGVASAMLNAASSKEDVKFVQDEMVSERAKLKLLYVTPEKLAKSKRFMNRLEKCYSLGRLARIVIDEVHCCSQWGHDFRPDYKFLGIMKRQFPTAPILGLTATATTAVLDDVKKILNIPGAYLFKASFNRPNLFYEVRQKPNSQKETIDEIFNLIQKRFHNKSGIVYCFSRKETEEVTVDLMSRGIKTGCYHADMDPRSRSKVHRDWLAGDVQVVVATVAFGMGIDKPDVRFVIHHSISKSMENLYQESGRAGRDDKRADCIVLYRFADVARQSSMVFTEQTGLHNLHGIVKYCIDKARCRRSVLASHFGEVWDRSHCNSMCDNCQLVNSKGTPKSVDVTKHCQDVLTILDAAAATEQRVTSAKLVDAWYGRGPTSLKVKSVSAPVLGRDAAERILANMLINGYVQEDFHFTAYSTICYIVAGSKARLLRSKTVKVNMDFHQRSTSLSSSKSSATPSRKSPAVSTSSTTPSLSATRQTASSEVTPKSCGKSLDLSTAENSSSASKPVSNKAAQSRPKTSSSKQSVVSNSEKILQSDSNGTSFVDDNRKKSRKSHSGHLSLSKKDSSRTEIVGKSCHSGTSISSKNVCTDTEGSSPQLACAEPLGKNDKETLKRKLDIDDKSFSVDDDDDDNDDFDIKKPRGLNATKSSIVISDSSEDEVL
ncbi:ATP-dependent DNA helicase Q1-like [Elysia marginata]|uniref:ATP-dependent DNA helicase n=1 Tax=Elysia marginata TaxID=1093978 RepID=A0AAV4HV01_9GAST|nr:ATP-dependent DNA helicase Q1-like [Elysia marginata]